MQILDDFGARRVEGRPIRTLAKGEGVEDGGPIKQ
jgi:hypothetical protein